MSRPQELPTGRIRRIEREALAARQIAEVLFDAIERDDRGVVHRELGSGDEPVSLRLVCQSTSIDQADARRILEGLIEEGHVLKTTNDCYEATPKLFEWVESVRKTRSPDRGRAFRAEDGSPTPSAESLLRALSSEPHRTLRELANATERMRDRVTYDQVRKLIPELLGPGVDGEPPLVEKNASGALTLTEYGRTRVPPDS